MDVFPQPFTPTTIAIMTNETLPKIKDDAGYQNPPDDIAALINAAPTPGASLS